MNPINFGNWLKQAVILMLSRPMVWLGYVLFCSLIFAVARVSLALGVFLAICCVFVGVGVAAYIDQKIDSLRKALNQTLPLAIIAAATLVSCWFIFRLVANLYSGEYIKILQFFFLWELTPENLDGKSLRQLIGWLYSAAIMTPIFLMLMLNSFASWFSFPLMVFKKHPWSVAKEQGRQASVAHSSAFYKLMSLLFALAILGNSIIPIFTPLFYMLLSSLMYVSYKNVFENQG